MIARLHILVPFNMVVPDSATFPLASYRDDGYQVTFHPPARSDLFLTQEVPVDLRLDDQRAFVANALRIDFQKETFDRREGAPLDPPEPVIRRALDFLLTRLRYVTRNHQVTAPNFPGTSYRLEYLDDKGTKLEPTKGLNRARGARGFSLSAVPVTSGIWQDTFVLLPDWTPPPWHDLLIEATGALPKVGMAVVLASTALEVFVTHTLDELAKRGDVPGDVWDWINDRDNRLNDPSTEEQFDLLLKHFVGHSLKEDKALWGIFQNLRTARNKFVHEGVAKIGGEPISLDRAARLVSGSGDIVNLVRTWLPEDLHWPEFSHTVSLVFEVPFG